MEIPQPRQTFALVFCDIVGTTALIAQEGDLVISAVLRDFYEQSGRLSQEHHCALMKFIGDGFLAAFEDTAAVVPFLRSIQDLFHTVPTLSSRGLAFRFSLHFGDALCIETSYGKDILGDELNLAAHLNALAQPGQIVITQAAFDRMPVEQQALAGPGETVHLRSSRASPSRDHHRHRRGGNRTRHSPRREGSAVVIHRIALLAP
jgi:adenylate cyclase